GSTPSVELMRAVDDGMVGYELLPAPARPKPVVVDVSNYKFLEKGLISVPLRNALQENIAAGRPSVVLLNRRGTYRVTKCKSCGRLLKCGRCDSGLAYSRARRRFECKHCNQHLEQTPQCPDCGGLEWKSYGMGVEQIHKELGALFPGQRIHFFEK